LLQAPSVTSAPAQYVLTPGVTQFSVPQTPKLMYLPPSAPHLAAGGSYYLPQASGGHPSVMLDQAGKPVIVGNPMQMPVHYQIAAPAGLKVCFL